MKLTTNPNVTVDGVMQGLGGPEEDPTGGFERGGWAMPFFGGETETLLTQVYGRADAFLFGRRTYAVFAGSWGAMEDMKGRNHGQDDHERGSGVAGWLHRRRQRRHRAAVRLAR